MATNKHTDGKDPEKAVDVPPYGSRNPDPVTDQPGSHPVETGIGAILGGVASGLAVGMVGGPVGAVIGGIVGGAAAGGLAGKGVGELVDPTTEDNWLREYHETSTRSAVGSTGSTHSTGMTGSTGSTHSTGMTGGGTSSSHTTSSHTSSGSYEDYRPAYKYGMTAATDTSYTGKRFEDVESHLKTRYESDKTLASRPYSEVRGAIKDAYDRTLKLHEERLKVNKTSEQAGEARIRKEVITEHQQVTVPVQREELVIERHTVNKVVPGGGHMTSSEAEVRIPLREEHVTVGKETVLKEEVSIGKKVTTENKTVGAEIKHEELVTDESTGTAKVKIDQTTKKSS